MTKRWTAVLLAAVMIFALVAMGAAMPSIRSEAEDTPAGDGIDQPAADDSADGDGAQSEPAVEYELKPQTNVYSFNMVCPVEDNPLVPPTFTSGKVVIKGTNTECTAVRYEWYAADLHGVPSGEVLGTEATFDVKNDPAYNVSRIGSHFYLEKAYVSDTEVGSQLFCAAVMANGTALLVKGTQNDKAIPDKPTLEDGPITLVAQYDQTYRATLSKYIKASTENTSIAYSSGSINTGTATYYPRYSTGVSFTGDKSLTGQDISGQGITQPTLTIENVSSPNGYVDFYFVLTFPFKGTAKLLDGASLPDAEGTVKVFSDAVRIYTGEKVAMPTPTPGTPDDPASPSEWTTQWFEQSPLTQTQSEALYEELIWPYHDASQTRKPFALLQPTMASDGYLTAASQTELFNLVNFVRRSGGVDLLQTISQQYNTYAQAGTNYMSATDQFGHDVADGSGNTNAIQGLKNSNLAWAQLTPVAPADIFGLQMGQFYDDDSNNVGRLGHRRWLMDNRFTTTGFGYTAPTSSNPKTYEATYIIDSNAQFERAKSLEAFPGVGAYPVELMDFRVWSLGIGQHGWTVDQSKLAVSITRESDGKRWDLEAYPGGGHLVAENWFDLYDAGRGSGPVVVFRPVCIYSDGNFRNPDQLIGETFTVTVEGVADYNGVERTIVYGTQFYSLADYIRTLTPVATPTASATATLSPSPTSSRTTAPSATATATRTTTPSSTATATRTAAPVQTPTPTLPTPSPSPTPEPKPDVVAAESALLWNANSAIPPTMSVDVPPSPACSFTWYATTDAAQDPSDGVRLPDTGSSCIPDTAGWSAGQTKHFVCVVTYADQAAHGPGETVIRFSVRVRELPDAIEGASGVTAAKPQPVPSTDPDIKEAFTVELAPDAFHEQEQPEIILTEEAVWTVTAAGTDGTKVEIEETTGDTVKVPAQAGLYTMIAKTEDGSILFTVPVQGTVSATPAGADYDADNGTYALPAGSDETVITAQWDSSRVKAPLKECVEYVWRLVTAGRARAEGPTLLIEAADVDHEEGSNVWIARGEGADKAVLTGLAPGSQADVSVGSYAPGTYQSGSPVAIGNITSVAVEASDLPVLSYSDLSAQAGQARGLTAQPVWTPVPAETPTYQVTAVTPEGGPAASVSASGVLTVPASQLSEAGTWTYTVEAVLPAGAVEAQVRLTVQAAPTQSPTTQPTQTSTAVPTTPAPTRPRPSNRPVIPTYIPTYVPTYNPTPSPSPSATASPSAIASATVTPAAPTLEPDEGTTITVAPEQSGTGSALLTGVPISTVRDTYTLEDLIAAVSIPEDAALTIETAAGEPLPASDPIATGCRILVQNPAGSTAYTVVVRGDVLGTGRLETAQLTRMAADINGTRPLSGVYSLAGKLTKTQGPVNIADLVELAKMLLSSKAA